MKKKLIFSFIFGMIFLFSMIATISAFDWDDDNLVSYYSFEETSGAVKDELNVNNATAITVTRGETGKIGNGFLYVDNPDNVFKASPLGFVGNNLSGTMWVNLEKFVATKTFFIFDGNNDESIELGTANTDDLKLNLWDTGASGAGTYNYSSYIGEWTFIYWEVTPTTLKVYLNNELKIDEVASFSMLSASVVNVTIGNFFAGNRAINGSMDEVSFWNRTLTESERTELYNDGNGLAFGETVGAVTTYVTLLVPTSGSTIVASSQNFTVNLTLNGSATNLEWVNNTYHIWFSNGTLFNSTLVSGLSGNQTTLNQSFGSFIPSAYIWNSYACYNNASFGNCSWGDSGNITFNASSTINSFDYEALSYETATENYFLNITSLGGTTPTNAKLDWNGTNYTAIVTSLGGGNFSLSYSKTIPEINESHNVTLKYFWTTSGVEQSLSYNQTLNFTIFTLCNTTYATKFLNITFKDENTLLDINASISTSEFIYYIGDGSVNKTYSYSNNSNNDNYTFCAYPTGRALNVLPTIQYRQVSDYPQRIWEPSVRQYNSTMTTQVLYLLSTTDGIYVTYQILDGTGGQLEGVDVVATRTIGEETIVVGVGTTDDSGIVTFWMNPDFLHTVTFEKEGYDSYTLNHFPTQSTYTLTLGSASSSLIDDYIRGMVWTIQPTLGTTLTTNTNYNFNFTLNSSYWELDSFGFDLYGDDTILSANSSTESSGGLVRVSLNISNYTRITINYYWVINGTTTNASGEWIVFDYEDDDWSIKQLITDFTTFVSEGDGLFGLDADSLNFVIFFIILIGVGIMSYKFSLTSPASISGMVFALVFLFDVALGLITLSIGVAHLPTIIVGLVMVGLIVREVTT